MLPAGRYERIYAVVSRIPRGRVATYGQVARLAGLAGQARMVGYALSALEAGRNAEEHASCPARPVGREAQRPAGDRCAATLNRLLLRHGQERRQRHRPQDPDPDPTDPPEPHESHNRPDLTVIPARIIFHSDPF